MRVFPEQVMHSQDGEEPMRPAPALQADVAIDPEEIDQVTFANTEDRRRFLELEMENLRLRNALKTARAALVNVAGMRQEQSEEK